MKIKINDEICIGCGTCESLCPKAFKVENGKARVASEDGGDCDCQSVANSCPLNAISIEEE